MTTLCKKKCYFMSNFEKWNWSLKLILWSIDHESLSFRPRIGSCTRTWPTWPSPICTRSPTGSAAAVGIPGCFCSVRRGRQHLRLLPLAAPVLQRNWKEILAQGYPILKGGYSIRSKKWSQRSNSLAALRRNWKDQLCVDVLQGRFNWIVHRK